MYCILYIIYDNLHGWITASVSVSDKTFDRKNEKLICKLLASEIDADVL